MRTTFAAILTLASILIACGGEGDTDETAAPSPTAEPAAEIPVVEITKTEQGFDAPDSIPGGLTRLRVHNADTREHAVEVLRFRDVGTLDQLTDAYALEAGDFAASFAASSAEISRLTTAEGGTGPIAPGGEAEVVLDLAPGRYVIYRFPSIGGLLARELEVTAAPDRRPAPPESAFTVGMLEFAYDGFPDTLPAGKRTVEVVNEGQQFHLMAVRRVNEEGITAEQMRQLLGGTPLPVEPSYTGAGGMGELEPGGSAWATLDLEPGVYTLICTVFDLRDGVLGKLHTVLGMHHAFTVQ
jgi:hypothetical protein